MTSSLPPLPEFTGPNYDPTVAVWDYFKLAIASHVSTVLEIPLEKAYEAIQFGGLGKAAKGDLTVPVPRFKLPGNPTQHAQKVVDALKPDAYLASVIMQGPLLIFTANTATLFKLVLEQINALTYISPLQPNTPPSDAFASLSLEDASGPKPAHVFKTGGYGCNNSGNGKSLICEFSSPNIAKPFHAGHLRSTIIGAFIANLYEANGWSVCRMNYLGDWGKQFGLLAVGFKDHGGSEEELEKNPIKHLYDVYVAVNKAAADDESIHDQAREFFVKMEAGDEEALARWRQFRDLSIVKYKETYARLNIHFDVYSGESQVSNANQAVALDQLQQTGFVEESKGALIVDLEKFKLGKTIVRKTDGTYVYITRDIAGAAERFQKYNFDKMIYVVASQQDLHLAQFFKVLDLMEFPWSNRLEHVNFGMVQGMSTRKGTAVFLDDIINESKNVMHEQMQKNEAKYAAVDNPAETSDKLGITAVKIQDMSAKRVNNYEFKWERMTSFEGDTGPYLQYAHVRIASIERKNAPELVLPPPSERSQIDVSVLTEPAARQMVVLLATFPDVVKTAMVNLEPSTIVTYCFRLTHAISSALQDLRVKGEAPDVGMARLWLFVCAKDVLASAMKLLTLEPLEKM